MDYKYIEQLLERYWQCETSLEEEEILRAFFSQGSVPSYLRAYAPLFRYSRRARKEEELGDDFDSKILALTEEQPAPVKALPITLAHRLMPLFKAAAVVAIIITIGNAARISVGRGDSGRDDINYANYTDTYSDPAMAYDEMHDALELMSEGFCSVWRADTVRNVTRAILNDSTKTP